MNEVKKFQNQAIQKFDQEFIPGLEGVEQDMLVIPRLKLVQKNSVEVDTGVKPGSLVNSMTKEVVAECKKDGAEVVVIPIVNNRSRIYFRPFSEGGGIICRSFDGKVGQGDPGGDCLLCPHSRWQQNEKGERVPPTCSEYLNVFVLVRGYDFPIPLTASFARTSAPAGRQLVNYFYMDSRRNHKSPWNFAYKLKTEPQKNVYGSFYVFRVEPAGKATPEEIEIGRQFYEMIRTASSLEIHADEEELLREQEKMEQEDSSDVNVSPDGKIPF